eukprot:335605-Chlamydomonas_euryale.AAC.1
MRRVVAGCLGGRVLSHLVSSLPIYQSVNLSICPKRDLPLWRPSRPQNKIRGAEAGGGGGSGGKWGSRGDEGTFRRTLGRGSRGLHVVGSEEGRPGWVGGI